MTRFEKDKQKRIFWKQRETHRRTLWVTQFTNMLGTALSALPMRFQDLDVRLPLPVNDGAFDLMEHEDNIPGTQFDRIDFEIGNFLVVVLSVFHRAH